ncbi:MULTISPECIES: hypothetical protein [Flavobacterium]|uniref:hypothetical protein n=1 Tax=Flavobacterium TaxID=237 RepID=UPI0009136344|nr:MULTISPECIES: hypothetical protein [Flavobacterium]MBJ2124315.1 hypothetical protein [Flavobacterium sp. IB48]OXA74244.1 hypothetical protein B0A67_00200 [Flavobacterium aquidurense]SHF90350.1 hypothetical protein SAMN05444481_10140 [Flavobacterium frigidimaris]
MMNKIYPLEWFDSLITQTLNINNPLLKKFSKQDFIIISEHIEKESKNIQNALKKEIFLLRKKREVRLQVRKYHSTIVYLLDTVIENQKTIFQDTSELSIVFNLLRSKLEEILSLVENRFLSYLSLDERVPITYLMLSRNELEMKLRKLSTKASESSIILKIIIRNLSQFLKSFSGKKITYRQLLYQKELLKGIKNIGCINDEIIFSEIDKVLIEKNFNSAEYVDYIIEQINSELETEPLAHRITKLLFFQKEFDRIYSNEKVSFDPNRSNIKNVVENWFVQEINYLNKKLDIELKVEQEDVASIKFSGDSTDNKLECDLSADQIALILRAADESRIVKARSMNHFFKMIVPYLSTPFKRELSYQSVRSKSYNAEERDKDIAVQTLERLIKKINSY